MILLRLISWQYARKHMLRTVLTTVGIVLGVMLFVGMHTANRSVLAGFNRTVDRIAGRAQLQVTAGGSGFAEEVLERVQAMPEVRAAAPVIEAVGQAGAAGQGNLLILGVDMTGDRSLRDYDLESGEDAVIDDPLVFLAQPDSIIVTREFAARNHLETGSRLPLDTMDGRKQFVVRGILKAGGMASAFGGNLAVMDIYAAQLVFGRGRRFDRIDIGVKEGVKVEHAQRAIQAALGTGFEVEPPSGRGRHFESLLSVYTIGVNITTAFALFIGMFIIYNSFGIAVTERRGEIGILRALGATRGQIRALFLAESAVAGLLGSAAGAVLGLLMSSGLTASTSALMFNMYGVAQSTEEVVVDPRLLAAAIVTGVITSMIAAYVPARSAAAVDPVQALQKGRYQVLSAGENRVRRRLAVACIAVAAGTVFFGRRSLLFYTGYGLSTVAMLLLTPALALVLARALRSPLKWLRPVEGALAADSLIQAPRRTSGTVAALMLSLSMVIGLAGLARASLESIGDWTRTTLNPDLFVSTTDTLVAREFHFPPSMKAVLERIPGIAEVQSVRTLRVPYRGSPIMLIAVEAESIGRRIPAQVVAGDRRSMYRETAAGRGVIVSENLAELRGLKLGDAIQLAAPGHVVRLPILGITRDYSNQLGSVFMDRGVYVRNWGDPGVDIFRIYLQPGASADDVRARIFGAFAGRRRLFVLMNADVKKYVNDVSNQWFGMTYIQLGVAVLVAVLGIVNTLTVSISDRRRELGVLRAVGGLRSQIRRTIWLEALAVGAIGLLLGVGYGAVNLYYQRELIRQFMIGFPFDYRFPAGIALLLGPVILGAAFAAAVLPAESAVRRSLVEALEYE